MSIFQFKYFTIFQSRSALKVGTDSMVLGALIESNIELTGLDIGSGTGVLSLMIAQKNPRISIDAIEFDFDSYLDCHDNFKTSQWQNRLTAIHNDFLDFTFEKKYDLIFSNPPFYKDGLLSKNERTAKSKHATILTFDKLIRKSATLLTENGFFWLISPIDQVEYITKIAQSNGLFLAQIIYVEGIPNRPSRAVMCFSNQNVTFVEKNFVIRTIEGKYSDQYISATKEYHAKNIG
jgi:tRNA1Val (adenine37-N6)-methyltransferase